MEPSKHVGVGRLISFNIHIKTDEKTNTTNTNTFQLVEVIAWCRGKLRFNFTRVFKVPQIALVAKLRGQFEKLNLKTQVRVNFNFTSNCVITC